MKDKVLGSKEVWKSPDGQRTIWEVKLQNGGTLQTFSRIIAEGVGQEFEIETYEKSGKTYVRQVPKPQDAPGRNNGKNFEADPKKIASEDWRQALGTARQAVKDYYDLATFGEGGPQLPDLTEYKRLIVNAAITFASAIEAKPDQLIDFDKDDAEETDDDKPPADSYEEQIGALT